jgi:hypothetical protein
MSMNFMCVECVVRGLRFPAQNRERASLKNINVIVNEARSREAKLIPAHLLRKSGSCHKSGASEIDLLADGKDTAGIRAPFYD